MTREYDEAGNVASENYFDEKEEPVLSSAGYHRIDRTWADPKHADSEAWFGTDGLPMAMSNNTYVRIEREFDEDGNTVTERYYGPEGEPAACKDGYDEIRRVYNDNKQAVSFDYFLGRKPFTLARGYTRMMREYGEDGLVSA